MKESLRIAALEVYKLSRQKKSLMALLGMNCIPVMTVVLMFLVIGYGAVSKGTLNFSLLLGFVPTWSRDLLNVHFAAFMAMSGFFLAMFMGEIISREFSDGTIEAELLTPVTRLQVFLGKLAGIFFMYAVSLLAGLAVLGSVTGIYYYGRPGWFEGVARVFAPEEVGVVLLCGLFMTTLTGAIAAFASSIEACMGYAVSASIFMGMADAAVEVFRNTGDLSAGTYEILKYSFTRAMISVVEILASSETGAGVIVQLKHPITSLAVHSLVFMLIGYAFFRAREVQAA